MLIKTITCILCCMVTQQALAQTSGQLAQYPSPMQEDLRRHERIKFDAETPQTIILNTVLPKPITIYLPTQLHKARKADILFHFHGTAAVVSYAGKRYQRPLIAVAVNLGSGSSAYALPFNNDTTFEKLKRAVADTVEKHLQHQLLIDKIILSGFSAGYGAVRSILSTPGHFKNINTILLLDGLHASYIPEKKVMAEGGRIDSVSLAPFLQFAREAANKSSGKKFLFTHSEIFPGTFVSTTEAARYLLNALQIKPTPVMKWGPLGMQQISEASKGNFSILGFAGNTAPDHIDHFHGLYYFLRKL